MRTLFFLFLVAATAGCASTRITNTWTRPATRTTPLKQVAILSVVADENRALRAQMERAIATELTGRGFRAFSTFNQFGPGRFERTDTAAAVRRLREAGADAIITIVLLDKSKETQYVPGRSSYTPVGLYYNRFWGYYGTIYDRMYTPGYYATNTRYFWETNLYDLDQTGDALVYNAQSESFNPSSTDRLARQYARRIVEDMEKSGVLRMGR